MTKVNLEFAQELLRLHDLGHSFVDLAKTYSLDNKTVSSWVKKAEDSKKELHWADIAKDLDTQLQKEHHQMLLAAARGVLRAVETPPKSIGPSQSAEVLLKTQVLAELQKLEEILANRGINAVMGEPGFSGEDDWNLLEGMAAKLQVGLFQHLPELEEAKEKWASDWKRFRDEKDELVKSTARALVHMEWDAAAAEQSASDAVDMLLGGEMAGRDHEDPHDPALNSAVAQAKPRWDSALDALARVRTSVASCRWLVEDVLLRGGPPGRCNSC